MHRRLAKHVDFAVSASRPGGWFWALLLVVLVAPGLTAQAASDRGKAKFLLVSDFHFNPMADPALVVDLAAADPAHWESILDRTTPATFSQYGSDTN